MLPPESRRCNWTPRHQQWYSSSVWLRPLCMHWDAIGPLWRTREAVLGTLALYVGTIGLRMLLLDHRAGAFWRSGTRPWRIGVSALKGMEGRNEAALWKAMTSENIFQAERSAETALVKGKSVQHKYVLWQCMVSSQKERISLACLVIPQDPPSHNETEDEHLTSSTDLTYNSATIVD